MKKLIINADDFGWSREVVDSIIELHQKGVITSTSVMATMPAFEYGIEKLKENVKLGAGIHLSLFDGHPILPPREVSTLIDEKSGKFLTFEEVNKNKRRINLNEAAAEYEAQILCFLETGVIPTHIDVHTSLPYMIPKLFNSILKLNEKYKLPMRTIVGRDLKEKSRDLARRQKIPAFIIRLAGNRLLKGMSKFGISHPDYFITDFSDGNNEAAVDDKIAIIKSTLINLPEGITEILTHPSLGDEKWRQIENEAWNSKELQELLKPQKSILSTYRIFDVKENNEGLH
ncbi:MAG: ChbG/HpnK family deacetylase [Spirochaetales bacterium]|nr:ChbG/HpnK family deacetylase [Spirochaetales bacterium]